MTNDKGQRTKDKGQITKHMQHSLVKTEQKLLTFTHHIASAMGVILALLSPTASHGQILSQINHAFPLDAAANGDETETLISQIEPPRLEPGTPPSREELEQQWLLPLPPVIEIPTERLQPKAPPRVAPGSSVLTPTGFAASWGQTFAGAGFQERTRYTDSSDGAFSMGFGMGDPRRYVSFQTTITVLDLFDNRSGDDGFMKRGSFSFKASRLLPNDFAVAAGIENAIVWGYTDAGTSIYGVVTKTFRLKETTTEPLSRVTVSAGIGNGRFRTEEDFQEDNAAVNLFGSVGLRVARPVSVIADWSGQNLALAVSVAPFPNIPVVITPSLEDITGSAGDGARFRLSVGYSHFFRF